VAALLSLVDVAVAIDSSSATLGRWLAAQLIKIQRGEHMLKAGG